MGNIRLISDGGSLVDHVKTLTAGLERRAERRFQQEAANLASPGYHIESVFSPFLEKMQADIEGALQKFHLSPVDLAKPPPLKSPVWIDWGKEVQAVKSSFTYLNGPNATASQQILGQFCHQCLDAANGKISELTKSLGMPFQDIEQQKVAVVRQMRKEIGQLLFVADRCPDLAAEKVDPLYFSESMQDIGKLVKQQLEALVQQLICEVEQYQVVFPDEIPLIMSLKTPLVIAQALITSNEQLNSGLIEDIKAAFIPNNRPLEEWEQGMVMALDQMDADWQSALDAVQLPIADSTAERVVRADLGLRRSEQLTTLHLKQNVIFSALSQLRQGPVGDCFAVAWAIQKHQEFTLKAVQDYVALLSSGRLVRFVNGNTDGFFFVNTVADQDLSRSVELNPEGMIDQSAVALWQCPNFILACRQMGIDDVQSFMPHILHAVFGASSQTQTFTWEQLIDAAAHAAKQAGALESQEALASRGKYVSATNNLLLRAWETSLAAMAEATPKDYVRGNIDQCVSTVLQPVFNAAKKGYQASERSLVAVVQNVFMRTLNDSFRLIYNASIPLKGVAGDGNSTDGGFELYTHAIADYTYIGEQVEKPEDFRQFVLNVCDRTLQTELVANQGAKDQDLIKATVGQLKATVNAAAFLKDILYAYEPENKKVADPVAHYQDLSRTPWKSLDGDDPAAVEAIDSGFNIIPNIKTIKPGNPYALLKWMLDLASWKEKTQHYLEDKIPDELDSATGPDHAFNIPIENDEFQAFLHSDMTSDAFIKKNIIATGMKVAAAAMDNSAKQKMFDVLMGSLNAQFTEQGRTIPESLEQELEALKSGLDKATFTVHQYAQRIQAGFVDIFNFNQAQKHEISALLDSLLIDALPEEQRSILSNCAFRFADTNWNDNEKKIYFCGYFNPRTETISFGRIDSDRQGLQAMDEYQWVDNQEWTVDPIGVKLAETI